MKRFHCLLAALLAAACGGVPQSGRVVLGDEQFEAFLPLLEGRRVAVLSNQSGIVGDRVDNWCLRGGETVTPGTVGIPFGQPLDPAREVTYGPHIVDSLVSLGVNVTAVFAPEHGFRAMADAGERIRSHAEAVDSIPVLSLYDGVSLDLAPDSGRMSVFDVLVVDIQDVGLRYYTYYITMFQMMQACAAAGKPVVILDRPNPNGFYVDGPVLDMRYASGVGALPLAMVHGLTLGEMALMINGEGWLPEGRRCDVTVIPCRNYTHRTRCTLVLPPSPNLKDMRAVYLYSSTCLFEGTAVTAGRGTPWAFEIYGHPDLREQPFSFIPRSIPGASRPRYMDQVCYGADLRKVPLGTIWDQGVNLSYLIDAWNAFPPEDRASFFLSSGHFDRLLGNSWVREGVAAGETAAALESRWQDELDRFRAQRRPYLLYEE